MAGIVSTVLRLDPPLDRAPDELLRADRGLSVELEGGRRVRLDPANPLSAGFARILHGLSEQRLPVYVEVDSASAITRLLIPHVSRIVGVRPRDADTLVVELELSHGRHLLRRSRPDFDALAQRLTEAQSNGVPLIITEDDAHTIIDIRAFTPGPEGPLPPFPPKGPPLPPKGPPRPGLWAWQFIRRVFLWWWLDCVSPTRAQQAFDAMNATSCSPHTVPPPCIPFLYPDDGCWGRAHEMCRLMFGTGLKPRKVWIQGDLRADTRNNPGCFVEWGWHVAPTLCVRGSRFPQSQSMVIDPSLFTTPVSEAAWKGVQGDATATLTHTDASIFHLFSNTTDPTYVQTNQVLAYYRLQLQTRALQQGAPPYAHCP